MTRTPVKASVLTGTHEPYAIYLPALPSPLASSTFLEHRRHSPIYLPALPSPLASTFREHRRHSPASGFTGSLTSLTLFTQMSPSQGGLPWPPYFQITDMPTNTILPNSVSYLHFFRNTHQSPPHLCILFICLLSVTPDCELHEGTDVCLSCSLHLEPHRCSVTVC